MAEVPAPQWVPLVPVRSSCKEPRVGHGQSLLTHSALGCPVRLLHVLINVLGLKLSGLTFSI